MSPHLAVHASAEDADEDAVIPRGPSRILGATVGADLVARDLEQLEQLSLRAEIEVRERASFEG